MFRKNFNKKIRSVSKLADVFSKRAKLLKELVEQYLDLCLSIEKRNDLVETYSVINEGIYNNFCKINEFSDSIAQTITYMFFLARLNNTNNLIIDFGNLKTFIPSNFELVQKLLRLIDTIATSNEYESIRWILKELIYVINIIDDEIVFKQFSFLNDSKLNNKNIKDPYLYFYEDFLGKYDKDLKKNKGVYYTPYSIVNFIVISLNKLLKYNFGLKNGFADKKEVTVLDFATGTGTFLLEIIKCIIKEIPKQTEEQLNYINNHILKNIYGFEYLMSPYMVAHLRLFEYLREVCNFKFTNKWSRFKLFLVDTLDLVKVSKQDSFQFFF